MISTSQKCRIGFSQALCSCQSCEAEENPRKDLMIFSWIRGRNHTVYTLQKQLYNHCGDDGREDPPVLIPNTEVKLSYAESTLGSPTGG